MKKVFLWYPRRVWQVENDELVNRFMWWTWANNYSTQWRWLYQLKCLWMRLLPESVKDWLRKRKLRNFKVPPFNPNALAEFDAKYPDINAFVRIQRPICKDPKSTYWHARIINMIRRVVPNLIATELVGVQPMTGPVGQIFTLRHRYRSDFDGDTNSFNTKEPENA